MSLVAMGVSYKTASIDVRQRVAISDDELSAVLQALVEPEGVKEAIVLSTCNRVEAYVEAKTDRLGADALDGFFKARTDEPLDAECFYLHRGMDAVQHVLRVVSSLDSQVLGEAQILGQMRTAFERAQEAGTCGEVLTELFKRALNLGKRVRTETAIGADSVSLSTVAHRIARDSVADLSQARVLLVGAGEVARLSATYLLDDGVGELFVTSRTPEHAESFARETGAVAVPFEDRYGQAARCDIVFTMTSAQEPIIRRAELEAARVAAGTEGRPLVFIDEAVPRDVELACRELAGVRVEDLESMAAIIDEGIVVRMSAVPKVERLVEEAEQGFLSWMQERLVVPTIKSMYKKGQITVADELEHAVSALEKERGEDMTDAERAILEAYGNAIMKKLLHGPTIRLRKEAQTADSYYYTGAARYLFGIDAFPPGTHHTCHKRLCDQGEPCPMGFTGTMKDACQSGRGPR
ncbi:MAG: glutamyl-tRNA reductase [Coriobacteriaceae bacterium]|nr:glutamyl-tRNA reductase [Coriobacteriaceae bacterium]